MTLILSCVGTITLMWHSLYCDRDHGPPNAQATCQKFKIRTTCPGIYSIPEVQGYTRVLFETVPPSSSRTPDHDVSCIEKNVSIKLSSTKIQMCGPNSVDQAKEGLIHPRAGPSNPRPIGLLHGSSTEVKLPWNGSRRECKFIHHAGSDGKMTHDHMIQAVDLKDLPVGVDQGSPSSYMGHGRTLSTIRTG